MEYHCSIKLTTCFCSNMQKYMNITTPRSQIAKAIVSSQVTCRNLEYTSLFPVQMVANYVVTKITQKMSKRCCLLQILAPSSKLNPLCLWHNSQCCLRVFIDSLMTSFRACFALDYDKQVKSYPIMKHIFCWHWWNFLLHQQKSLMAV